MSVSVTLENVAKQYGAFAAVRGVSLAIQPGELIALLGPSGSGKTTLLRMMAGLEAIDGGNILFDGIDTSRLSLRDRRIGFVFQNYALFRHMSVADNIAFGLKVRTRNERPSASEISRRVSGLLELVQLGGLEKRFPSQISGGQRQRVALARALAIEPRVLLLDEPFGALDAKVRKDLRQWLRDLHRQTGHTTVFVTHDQEEALELADRVAILNKGLLEQVAGPDTVYDYPATAFVCDFLGETNRIPVELAGGRAHFENIPVYQGLPSNSHGKAELFLRPQHLKLVEPNGSPLSGAVELIRRHGSIRRAEVAIKGLAKRLDIDIVSQIVPAIGESVGVRITHAQAFPAG